MIDIRIDMKNISRKLFFFAIFLFITVFYTHIHPLMMYDGDDWMTFSWIRWPIPWFNYWNPTKVLPEDAGLIVGDLSANIIYPLIGDYQKSIVIGCSLFLAAIITVYMTIFARLIKRKFNLSDFHVALYTLVFLAFHFWVFQGMKVNCQYLFGEKNICCMFHYVLPAVWNASMVMFLMQQRDGEYVHLEKGDSIKKTLFYIGIYLSICSSIFFSVILALYVFFTLAMKFTKENMSKEGLKNFYNEHKLFVAIVIFWLISLLFESQGGDASKVGKSFLDMPFAVTANNILVIGKQISGHFLGFMGGIIVFAGGTYWRNKNIEAVDAILKRDVPFFAICSVLSFAYVYLVAAKAGGWYVLRGAVHFSTCFFLFMILIECAIYFFTKNASWRALMLPIFVLAILINTSSGKSHLREASYDGRPASEAAVFTQFLIDQVVEAEQNGQTEMDLHVPVGDANDNFPHPLYMGNRVSKTLLRHGVISRPIKITVVPDESVNERFRIAIPK